MILKTPDLEEDQKAAIETLEYEEKEPATVEWQLVTIRVLKGRHLSRRKYPFPCLPKVSRLWTKSVRDNYFQDQDNKVIYFQDILGNIHGPLDPEPHTGYI